MARKRVNKNLVAFLTVMGILLTVVVVVIATGRAASRDPEFWALKAREHEAAGDYELAIQLFDRAYQSSKGPGGAGRDVAYLAEAARCAYQYGDLGGALGTLQRAHDEQPDNREVMVAYLGHLWDLVPYFGRLPGSPKTVLEYAETLQEIDEQHVLGPLSEAGARWELADTERGNRAKGDEAFQRALELDEHDPRVVLARIQWLGRLQRTERLEQARQEGASESELAAIASEFQERFLAILSAGVQANPTDWRLVVAYADQLRLQGRQEQALTVLTQALEQREDDPELLLAMAMFHWAEAIEVVRADAEISPAAYEEMLTQAASHAGRAVEIEPALYEGYFVLAQSELLRDWTPSGNDRIAAQRYEKVLEIYDDAIRTTVGLRSLQAALGEYYQRRLMYMRAFNTAIDYYATPGTVDEKEQRLQAVRDFLDAAEIRYPEEPFTFYMRGLAAIVERDLTLAVQAFEEARQRAKGDVNRYPQLWYQAFRGELPVERLALLYRDLNQPGESLRYTDTAIEEYEDLHDAPAPLRLVLNRAELLAQLDRSEEALDYAGGLMRTYATRLKAGDRQRLAGVRAEALRRLNRPDEASQAIAGGQADERVRLLMQARLAYMEEDYAGVETALRALLGREDLNVRLAVAALQLLVPALAETDRQEEGKRILAEVRSRFGQDGSLAPLLDAYDVLLSYRDPQERDAKLLELIAAVPDPIERNRRYYGHYLRRRQYERADEYLKKLADAQPDEVAIQQAQFQMALRLEQFERAEGHAVTLSQRNVDHADGATYRGDLAFAQGRSAEAVRHYREAQAKLPRTCVLQVALGRALLNLRRYEEAVVALTEAHQLNPRDFSANKFLYYAYQEMPPEQRPPDGGESLLRTLVEINPDDPYVQQEKEILDPATGIERREKLRAEALVDKPPVAPDQQVENLVRLARLYIRTGKGALAIERLQEAARIDPGDMGLAQAAAEIYSAAGFREQGEQHLRAYLSVPEVSATDRVYGYALLAGFYERLGDLPAAESAHQDVKRTIEENVRDPEERRLLSTRAGFNQMEFYRRHRSQAKMIEAGRWTLDKLDSQQPGEDAAMSQIRRTIIQGLLNLDRKGQAEEEVNAYVRDYPEDANGLILQAQLYHMQGRSEEAYEALTAALQKLPDHVWSLLKRGQIGLRSGRYVRAGEDLLKAKGITKKAWDSQRGSSVSALYPTVCSELAGLYEVTEQYELAETELQNIMDLLSQRLENVRRLPEESVRAMRQGIQLTLQETADRLVHLYNRADQPEKAQAIVSEFMARYPNSPYWPYRLALAFTEEGDRLNREADAAAKQSRASEERRLRERARLQYTRAAGYYQRAQQLVPTGQQGLAIQYYTMRLDALAAAGQAEQAVQLFEQLQSRPGEIPAIVRAAVIRAYWGLNQREEALQQFELALDAAGHESVPAVDAVAGMANSELPAEDVLDVMRRVVERTSVDAPEGRRLRNRLAMNLIGAGRGAEALPLAEAVFAKTPLDSPERVQTVIVYAQALEQTGDIAGEIQALEQVIETYPNSIAALNNLAYVLADRADRPREALRYVERANALEPRNASILDTLAWVYFKNGRLDESEAALHKALSIDSENLPANYHLGVVYAERGRVRDAREMLQNARVKAVEQVSHEYQQKIQAALDQLP